ncbi:MAG: hypothetical protein ABSF44_05065 [Candidatus Bathyarchaeia archaeon]|jgi:hypothetical protein
MATKKEISTIAAMTIATAYLVFLLKLPWLRFEESFFPPAKNKGSLTKFMNLNAIFLLSRLQIIKSSLGIGYHEVYLKLMHKERFSAIAQQEPEDRPSTEVDLIQG